MQHKEWQTLANPEHIIDDDVHDRMRFGHVEIEEENV